jgi:hypothetical protein
MQDREMLEKRHLQVLQPVRARVELRRVCLVLESRANRWTPPRPLDEDADGVERLHVPEGVSLSATGGSRRSG